MFNWLKSCETAFLYTDEYSNKIGNNFQESVWKIHYFIHLEVKKLLTSACQKGRAVSFPWSFLSQVLFYASNAKRHFAAASWEKASL